MIEMNHTGHPVTQADIDNFIPFVKAVGRGEKLKRDLTYDESVEAMRAIMLGKGSAAQFGAFLIAQRVKGEAIDEINGFTDVLRSEFIEHISPSVDNLLDLAVPYDGKIKTAQLAPTIAILLAEAGIPVVLHGDDRVPTKEGIGPGLVFAAMGIPANDPPTQVAKSIESVGVGYLAAAQFSPAWHQFMPTRRQFGLRTVLNTIEKLFNPANAPYQISGFFHANYIDRLRTTQTGQKSSWVVQGEEGSVEIATGRRTHIYGVTAADDIILEPATVGLPVRERVTLPPVLDEHVQLNLAILGQQGGTLSEDRAEIVSTATDQVTLTVGTMLWVLGMDVSMAAGMVRVRDLLSRGRAMSRLQKIQQ